MPFSSNKANRDRAVFHTVTSNYVQHYRNGLHKNDHRGGGSNPVCPFWDECRLELRFNPQYGNWKIFKPEGCSYETWNRIRNWANDAIQEMDLEYKDFLMEKVREHDLFINCTKSKNLVPKMEKAYYDFIDQRNREQQQSPPPPITPPDTPLESLCGTPPSAGPDEILMQLEAEKQQAEKQQAEKQPTEEEELSQFRLTPEHSQIKKGTYLTRSWADIADEDEDEEIQPMMMFGALLTQSDPGIPV